jgi:hypothetical protein
VPSRVVPAAALGERVADPGAGQDVAEQARLLGWRAPDAQDVHEQEVRLRDLRDGGVDGGEDPRDLGQRRHRHLGAAERARDGDAEQARAVERGQRVVRDGRGARAVALDHAVGEGGRHGVRGVERGGVIGQDGDGGGERGRGHGGRMAPRERHVSRGSTPSLAHFQVV